MNVVKPFDSRIFLAAVGSGRTTQTYAKGQSVFSQGDPADSVYYVQNGMVKVGIVSPQGKEAIIAILSVGFFFGEGCLAGQQLRMASAVAMSPCSVVQISKAAMMRVLRDEPEFAGTFITHLLTRNIRIEEDLVDQLFNSSEKRLARVLLILANFSKEGRPEEVIPAISQETLAEMIGTTRSRVSFFLNKFRKLGFVEYRRKHSRPQLSAQRDPARLKALPRVVNRCRVSDIDLRACLLYAGRTMQACSSKPRKAAAFLPSLRLLAPIFVVALLAIGAAPAVADGISTVAQAAPAATTPPATFGNPPSSEIPILYNDHTVYATPDLLKQARVLAALVKDGQLYVPLRSMFEQMGAVVTASADGNTITAVKPGVTVSVTLDRNEVVINGDTRPLDVPPIMYEGVMLVPVRVLSEALGAYVLWVPGQRVVVVRYIPSTPEPVPTVVPTTAPTAAPIAMPTATPYPGFIEAAMFAPKNYNEFSAGQFCAQSYLLSFGYAFNGSRFAIRADYRQDAYVTSDNFVDVYGDHYTRFATIDGGSALTPVFLAKQTELDGRLEYQIAAPRVYIGAAYLHVSNNFGYPQLNAVGVGLEKLPDLQTGIGIYGSAFYYPSATGSYTVTSAGSSNVGKTYRQQYQILQMDAGLTLAFAHFPLYLYGGFIGDQWTAKQNAPIGQTHNGPYVGLGLKL